MRNKNIFNYIFILGLLLLILNDHFLKEAFGNWYTGKLSDFAGILIFPMFLKYCFRITTRKAVLFTIVGFLFWKSSLSQSVIDGFNALGWFRIGRVIDFTDFIAFLILPLTIYVMNNLSAFEIRMNKLLIRRMSINAVVLTSVVAFIATSDDSDIVDPSDTLFSCCTATPVTAILGSELVYIPTAFTPDGNGVNDFFQISSTGDIRVDEFLVRNGFNGDTVFLKNNMLDLSPTNGFDGVVEDTIIASQYEYYINMSKDGDSLSFAGIVCCIPCDSPLEREAPAGIGNCAFPVQYDMNAGFDMEIDSQEELDCFD